MTKGGREHRSGGKRSSDRRGTAKGRAAKAQRQRERKKRQQSSRPTRQPADQLPRIDTARGIAFHVLNTKADQGFVSDRLHEEFQTSRISSTDRRLATELANGVTRRRMTLDWILEWCVDRPLQQVETPLLELLRLGTYQIGLLTGIPPHAAVNETVALAKQLGKPQWTGILNGALRKVDSLCCDEFVDSPGTDALPMNDGRFRKLNSFVADEEYDTGSSILPDPDVDAPGYFAWGFSFPPWMIRRWYRWMNRIDMLRLCQWFNRPPHLHLRVNLLRTSREEVQAALAEAGLESEPGEHRESLSLAGSLSVTKLPGFDEGHWTVQDTTAMAAARLLSPQSDEQVLDLCAGVGTKSTHLAELMKNRGRIIATDISRKKLQRLEENCLRLGHSSIELRLIDPESKVGLLSELGIDRPFDAALVDVPCSNTGVLNRRAEARWRLSPEGLDELVGKQKALLQKACDATRPGGRIVYSTCSFEHEENKLVVDEVASHRDDLEILAINECIPGFPADGGFQALVAKRV